MEENKIDLACDIITAISDNVAKWEAYDLTPKQHEAVKTAVTILKSVKPNDKIQEAISLGQYMLDNYPIFTLHRF